MRQSAGSRSYPRQIDLIWRERKIRPAFLLYIFVSANLVYVLDFRKVALTLPRTGSLH